MSGHLGIVGAGNIGAAVASRLAQRGWTVRMTSKRGGSALQEVCQRTGATPASLREISSTAPLLLLAVPFSAIEEIAEDLARGSTPVIDATNYYPGLRDVPIPAIEAGMPESEWVAEAIQRPLAKAFNSINFMSLTNMAREAGQDGRIALPISADDPSLISTVSEVVELLGFDAVPAGTLAQSWRQQPGAPAYCTDLSRDQLLRALDAADRTAAPVRRDRFIERMREPLRGGENPDLIALSREVYGFR